MALRKKVWRPCTRGRSESVQIPITPLTLKVSTKTRHTGSGNRRHPRIAACAFRLVSRLLFVNFDLILQKFQCVTFQRRRAGFRNLYRRGWTSVVMPRSGRFYQNTMGKTTELKVFFRAFRALLEPLFKLFLRVRRAAHDRFLDRLQIFRSYRSSRK